MIDQLLFVNKSDTIPRIARTSQASLKRLGYCAQRPSHHVNRSQDSKSSPQVMIAGNKEIDVILQIKHLTHHLMS